MARSVPPPVRRKALMGKKHAVFQSVTRGHSPNRLVLSPRFDLIAKRGVDCQAHPTSLASRDVAAGFATEFPDLAWWKALAASSPTPPCAVARTVSQIQAETQPPQNRATALGQPSGIRMAGQSCQSE